MGEFYMGYNNNYLIREYVGDIGDHVSGYLYSSPDIICHEQVLNPQEFFSNNYDTDPNQAIDRGSIYNMMYARVKRLTDSSQPDTGYLHLYQCGSSLFMKPSSWREHQVSTMNGEKYIAFTSGKKEEILVGNDIFIANKEVWKYCLAAVISDNEEGTIPEDFTSYDTFNHWVRSNPAVALRNLTIMSNYIEKTYERADAISGVGTYQVFGGFKLVGTNLPKDTIIGIKCEPLNIKIEQKYNKDLPLTACAMIPPDLNAYVISYAITPDGKWPVNADLTMEYWTESLPNHLCYKFGAVPKMLGFERNQLMADKLDGNGKLVLTGRCSTLFVNA